MANKRFKFTRVLANGREFTEMVYYKGFRIENRLLYFYDTYGTTVAVYNNWTEIKQEEY